MRQFQAPIDQLVQKGSFQHGNYNTYIKHLNPMDADIFNQLTPELFKQTRLKEWHAFQLGDDRFFCFFVLMDLKITSMIQITFYDRETRRLYKRHMKLPPMTVKPLENMLGNTLFFSKDDLLIDLCGNLNDGSFRLSLSFKNELDQLPVKLFISSQTDVSQPLISSIPLEKNGAMYAMKQMMPMQGQLMISSKIHQFDEASAFLIIDDQKAFYPFEIKWHWVTCAGRQDGRFIGLNLTHNQSADPDQYNENALWIDDQLFLLPHVTFDIDVLKWRIRDAEGLIDLTFTPKVMNRMDESHFYVKSAYKGPFGFVEGTIRTETETIVLQPIFGMAEDFYLRA